MHSTSRAAQMPTSMETRAPIMTRTMMSRPKPSVPKMWGKTFSPAAFRSSSVRE